MNAVRGACPSLSEPMPSGDGLIARLHPAGGVTPGQFRALCNAAGRFGNGLIEVTQRGNLQFRGLTSESAPEFAHAVNRLGIAAEDGPPIDVSPLSGDDPSELADARPIAGSLRQTFAQTAVALAPKVSVVIDGGGAIGLGASQADIRLEAIAPGRWLLSVAGGRAEARRIGSGTAEQVVAAAFALLKTISRTGAAARARDLGATALAEAAVGLKGPGPLPLRENRTGIGTLPLRNGLFARGFGLPFGATARDLSQVADSAAALGCEEFRFAPARTILAILPAGQSDRLARACRDVGFVTAAADPRSHVAACSGRPACASAHISARTLAPAVADAARDLFDGSMTIHLSGCAKGCAHPGPAALTIAGDANGASLVVGGTASGASAAHVTEENIVTAIQTIATRVREAARTGETVAATIARLGAGAIAKERTPTAA
ncbi:MAG: precorrin-3B synthase [Rhizobiaceae bacterium]